MEPAENKCDCKYELEKYKITLDFLKFEATTLWQIFNAFFVAHAIFIGFVSSSFIEGKNPNIILLLISGIVGFLLAILWFGTFHRNSKWYNFRMDQAKNAETALMNNSTQNEWYLLNKKAGEFTKDHPFISNKTAGYLMIIIFIVIYLFIILCSLCKIVCNC